MHLKLHISLVLLIEQVLTKQIFDAEIMKHAVKSKWFNVNPDDLDIAVYESQKIHSKLTHYQNQVDLVLILRLAYHFQRQPGHLSFSKKPKMTSS